MASIPKNPDSALEIFLALVQIPSPSKKEKLIIDSIAEWLDYRGLEWEIDDAGVLTGSNTGNLIVWRGSRDGKKPLLLAHVDTVEEPGYPVSPVIESGAISSKGSTILGADNKSAVAALLYLCSQQQGADESDAVIAFTVSEESGVMGANSLYRLSDQVSYAFSVDGSEPVGTIINKALGYQAFKIEITGRSAHAAQSPEKGVHAVQAASQVVANLPLGRSPDFTINIGRIVGGGESNIIPAQSAAFGEVRSYSEAGLKKGLDLVQKQIDGVAKHSGAQIKLLINQDDYVPPFTGENNQDSATIAVRAAENLGITTRIMAYQATFEASILDSFGIPTAGIASGGQNAHSDKEMLSVAELERLPALLREILREVRNHRR